MNDVSVIDRYLDVYSRYIDSGFGLLGGEVAFLSATLVAIDVTLAGLYWAMSSASGGGGDDVIAKLVKKVIYVGAFAYIIGNFNALAGIVFRSFAGLGLVAAGSTLTQAQLLQPGRVAQVGLDAARPFMLQISGMTGFPQIFANAQTIGVLFLSWLVLIVSFFVLAVQLFVTLIEFKLTVLAGFVLVPFALWNKTAFLAEKVLGNVVSSGVKVLVLAVIIGIGSSLFAEFKLPAGREPSIDQALVVMLAALTMLGLGIFGPGIATGLVSGAPQLGAGAAAGTAIGAAGLAVAGGAAVAGAGSAVAAGARMAPGAARTLGAMAGSAQGAYRAGAATAGGSGIRSVGAGMASVGRAAASAVGERLAASANTAKTVKEGLARGTGEAAAPPVGGTAGAGTRTPEAAPAPDWARRLQGRQRLTQGASAAVHVLRSGDHAGGGASPSLRDDSNS